MLASQGAGTRAASAHAQTRNWKLQFCGQMTWKTAGKCSSPKKASVGSGRSHRVGTFSRKRMRAELCWAQLSADSGAPSTATSVSLAVARALITSLLVSLKFLREPMAVVTLRELIDRWEAGDSHAAEFMERPWTPGLSAAEDEEAADAMAASLVPDVRRVCHLCSGGDARMWSTVLASLATPLMPPGTARPRSMVPSLLQRMRIQTASDGTPLAQEIDEACASTLQSYSLFIAGVVRLGRLPDYAMPFELAIAAAHGCTALEAAGAQEPPVKELLRALAESPDIPGQRE
ncbi:unnamed protein product, partial [Symbiodinium necroappetens]